jgi:hypothetical protein
MSSPVSSHPLNVNPSPPFHCPLSKDFVSNVHPSRCTSLEAMAEVYAQTSASWLSQPDPQSPTVGEPRKRQSEHEKREQNQTRTARRSGKGPSTRRLTGQRPIGRAWGGHCLSRRQHLHATACFCGYPRVRCSPVRRRIELPLRCIVGNGMEWTGMGGMR